MVPAMYNLCLLQPDFDSYDLSSWRIGGFGGAPMPIATIERLAAKIPGLKLMNCYGATETTSPSTMMPGELTAEPYRQRRIAVSGRADHRRRTPTAANCRAARSAKSGFTAARSSRATGTIRRRPRRVLPAASGIPAISARSMTQNFVRVFDRQKDMINRGGLKIYSAEVESVLAGPSRRGRERDHRQTLSGAGRARACRRGDPRRGRRRGLARLVRRAAVGLQGAGNHRR